MARHLHFLEAITQGTTDAHAEVHFTLNDEEVVYNHCERPIGAQGAWEHLAVRCSSLNYRTSSFLEAEAKQKFSVFEDTPHNEASTSNMQAAFWLRGILPLSLPDPLNLNYDYLSSFSGM